jgi:hypothetical protein
MTALMLAGGGAYYFAKREIDADRKEKFLKMQRKQRMPFPFPSSPPPNKSWGGGGVKKKLVMGSH